MTQTPTQPAAPALPDTLHDVRAAIAEAREVIVAYWPISTFVASNPLGGLEHLPFAQAMEYAHRLYGSEGYLPLESYRSYFAAGRINESDLAAAAGRALETDASASGFAISNSAVTSQDLYSFWLCHPVGADSLQATAPHVWQEVERLRRTNGALAQQPRPIRTLGDKAVTRTGQSVTDVINGLMTRWCAAFVDEAQAGWQMPGREAGFFRCWKELATCDATVRRYKVSLSSRLRDVPDEPDVALAELLQQLEIPKAQWPEYVARHLAALPGWASLIRWREEHPDAHSYPITLTDYIAVRLFYETVLVDEAGKPAQHKKHDKANAPVVDPSDVAITARIVAAADHFALNLTTLDGPEFAALERLAHRCDEARQHALWQDAYEWHYRHALINQLRREQPAPLAPASVAAAQLVMCIDVRSEGLRRHLEGIGYYETYGAAGFFGVLMTYEPFGESCAVTLAPALVRPTQKVREIPQPHVAAATVQRNLRARRLGTGLRSAIHSLRESFLTPFAFVEMGGWVSALPLIGKTVAPRLWARVQNGTQTALVPQVATQPSFLTDTAPDEMSLEAQVQAAAGLLRCISLTDRFARLVVLCGHGSQSENNLYAAALDCGACGGNRGGSNATTAAAILNSPAVRVRLAADAIRIPDDTFFLAAEHTTTTDTFHFLNADALPPHLRPDFDRLAHDMTEAGRRNAQERGQQLHEGKSSVEAVRERATDWAQVRPEWGLARNAAFICGRRALTAGLSLDNRTFLHSYDSDQDTDGVILENILTAPVIVAEWINMNYYLSSVDNRHWGSGTKLLHTLASGVGVMRGRQSDLLLGLPQQSVMVGDELYHEPMRLCVIVDAPQARIAAIVAKHETLRHLTHNEWIALVARDPHTGTFHRYTPSAQWQEIDDAA